LICVVDTVEAAKVVGAAGFVYALTPLLATDCPLVLFTVQMIKVYCVTMLSPVIDFDVALAAAVVVVSELQSAGATAPDL
jgi:hypothetical protein